MGHGEYAWAAQQPRERRRRRPAGSWCCGGSSSPGRELYNMLCCLRSRTPVKGAIRAHKRARSSPRLVGLACRLGDGVGRALLLRHGCWAALGTLDGLIREQE